MLSQKDSLHRFKLKNFSGVYNREVSKFENVLYRYVPEFIFNAKVMLTKLFANGLAVMTAKITSMGEYVEHYFENDERRFNKK